MNEDYLYRFELIFDKNKLTEQALDVNGYKTFEDPANKGIFLDFWQIKKVNSGYAQDIAEYFMNLLSVSDIRPRFYVQKAGSSLGWHIDRDTLCSINIVLTGDSDPISFKYGVEYYTVALLNTQKEHAVLNTVTDRVLFKMSIFDKCYDDVKEILKTNDNKAAFMV